MSLPLVACLLLLPNWAEVDDLASGVLKFAHENAGRKVGDGEAATLAVRALEAAGARTTHDYKVSGPGKDYRWGIPVNQFADARPGDVIQFRDVVTVTRTLVKVGGRNTTRTVTRAYAHHTAIVAQNLGRGKFKVYEQNIDGPHVNELEKTQVQLNNLDLAGMTRGTVWIYRPVKK